MRKKPPPRKKTRVCKPDTDYEELFHQALQNFLGRDVSIPGGSKTLTQKAKENTTSTTDPDPLPDVDMETNAPTKCWPGSKMGLN